jgi:hypothetical protein
VTLLAFRAKIAKSSPSKSSRAPTPNCNERSRHLCVCVMCKSACASETNERELSPFVYCIQRLMYRSIALTLPFPLSPSHLRFLALCLSHSLFVLVCQQPPVGAGSVTNKIHQESGKHESAAVCQSCYYTRYQGKKSYVTRTGICNLYWTTIGYSSVTRTIGYSSVSWTLVRVTLL